jgi:hypothetical protein
MMPVMVVPAVLVDRVAAPEHLGQIIMAVIMAAVAAALK